MKLVTEEELFGNKSGIIKKMAKPLLKMLNVDRLNEVYDEVDEFDGNDVTLNYLKNQNIQYTYDPAMLANIPTTGSLVFICNHPTGALDGVVMIDFLSRIRPDIKVMGNFLLSRMKPLKKYFIDVNPFESKNGQNIKGIRQSLNHVANGGALMIFPAGEVAAIHKKCEITDREWPSSIMKFIKRMNAPVVPLFLTGKNSFAFYFLGLIHPTLRTLLLANELVNKENSNVRIEIGNPIFPIRTASLSLEEYSKFLRTNVFILKTKLNNPNKVNVSPKNEEASICHVDPQLVIDEINELKKQHILFEQGNFTIFFAATSEMNYVMKEIGRQREITFREVGEGTNLETDIDHYDSYYHQLFIWNNTTNQIIGAYRIGIGKEILAKHGKNGFYTNSLFRMSDKMLDILEDTIELGRSFIIKEYQKKANSLMILWKGIMLVLLKHENSRYLLGPVSISNEYSDLSKLLIDRYIHLNHFNQELSKYIKPVNGVKRKYYKETKSYLEAMYDIDLLDKIICDLEDNKRGIPILIKKYLQLKGEILAFNIDPDFNNAMDGLLLLDLKNVPESTIGMLSKTIGCDVSERFKKYNNQ